MFYYVIVMKRNQATPAQRVPSVCCDFMALPMVDPSIQPIQAHLARAETCLTRG